MIDKGEIIEFRSEIFYRQDVSESIKRANT